MLPEFIEKLLNPEKYDDSPSQLNLVQTHISFVLISKDFVYKIKKPVNFGFLDFTTLEKRKFYCEKEIEYNSRLTPEIYEKVVEIRKKGDDYFFNGDGEIVEYAVKMKRFNEDNSLLNLLKNKKCDDGIFRNIAQKLVNFHNKYPAEISLAQKSIDNMKITTDENFAQTEKYIGITIGKNAYNKLKNYTNKFYEEKESLLKKRIKDKRIKECHGDLHLQHIIIDNNKILIIDCIEFNDRFRIIDVANEIAFLSMDLDYNGYENYSKLFVDYYVELSKDYEIYELLNFYKIYRAYVRGKVTSFLLDDRAILPEDKEKIKLRAKRYFELAESYLK